ncbi:citryl-CoA lyase [Geobacter pelophilus]|uniref:Citryl-CoA lyase n=1 Tax=Geoanaerobacter pelophilus TaxID=60036 RepID=A0AAW4L344_9BACT|nr:citryl-CoA lyase [Geoanaerobacter pelophilus]MBT0665293.1 citryl-CoA lyase [Geoanaerobacter pelophilus]
MSDEKPAEQIRTRIWLEEPEPDNPFATRAAYCHGYDVYGAMLGQARWVEMLYLLFRGDAPTPAQSELLEAVAVALANPGPRDPSVHAAMCGGVGGSTAAASLIAALAVGAGQLSGGRELLLSMEAWHSCGMDLDAWQRRMTAPGDDTASIWPTPEHPPGFDPHGVTTTTIVKQTIACLAAMSTGPRLPWLEENLSSLEAAAGCPLAMSGVAAAAFSDLGFSPEQGEMLFLLLRLPGAAAHALEQWKYGHKKFPFFKIELESDSEEVK